MKYFICEICKNETPIECEGSEPNTCADCMPLDIDLVAPFGRKGVEMGKFPREHETPPRMAQNRANLGIADKRVLKYETKHLKCLLCKDEKGQQHYQIFEKENMTKPVVIYINNRTQMKISNEVPRIVENYKYFIELGEIVEFLIQLDNAV